MVRSPGSRRGLPLGEPTKPRAVRTVRSHIAYEE